jgi:retron-type reverse transcriptase
VSPLLTGLPLREKKRSAQWVLEGDIKACFDKIGHQWLMDNVAINKRIEEKTHITHINDDFDFLGFNHRKYQGKKLIKPRKSNTLMFLSNLRELIKKHVTLPVNDLIKLINPKLRGVELLSTLRG